MVSASGTLHDPITNLKSIYSFETTYPIWPHSDYITPSFTRCRLLDSTLNVRTQCTTTTYLMPLHLPTFQWTQNAFRYTLISHKLHILIVYNHSVYIQTNITGNTSRNVMAITTPKPTRKPTPNQSMNLFIDTLQCYVLYQLHTISFIFHFINWSKIQKIKKQKKNVNFKFL